ncbi:MAG: glycosyltransferase [Gammaproteobacteria bacterium]|nr:TIGR04282 family arsenosugar biosynthesis glycosyltransferase [Gammaproteobacteria bacterium]MXY55184.1 glycosyltransferase [Gammaproteobacteria bacterium]MYF31556.1 glycosyltransferase [Gammaproteobacteria bacterium]MYK47073.1 glycosyltransferase [Gammaproteobacteria bacterium]
MNRSRPARVAIFARAPVQGRVKTRLARAVGAESALRVYEDLLASTLQRLGQVSETIAPEIWVDGDLGVFARWQGQGTAEGLKDLHIPLIAQGRGDLGQRMSRAFDHGVRVLVGTDIPRMTAGYVEGALNALACADLVLGPTEDGGYCLIGMNSPHPELFDGIAWGTASVLTSTLHAAKDLRVRLLDEMWDVDDVDDLTRWRGL